MAKLVVQHDRDPQIAVVLTEMPRGGHTVPGVTGSCTQCGWPMHQWNRDKAIRAAQQHVDGHEPVIIGGDKDSLVRN